MIKVSVLYPYEDGVGFDMSYYLNSHMPMMRQKLGAACKGVAVEQGLRGATPGSHPTYVAKGHLLFDSMESFQEAFAPHAPAIMADVPNYTALKPVIQISDVKMSSGDGHGLDSSFHDRISEIIDHAEREGGIRLTWAAREMLIIPVIELTRSSEALSSEVDESVRDLVSTMSKQSPPDELHPEMRNSRSVIHAFFERYCSIPPFCHRE